MTREEDIGQTLVRILERTRAITIPLLRVHQLLTELISDATEAECLAELVLLTDKKYVKATPYGLGGTLRYQLTADGVIARRRGEI